MSKLCIRLRRDHSGATSIEYALIAGLVAVVIVLSVTTVGDSLTTIFADVQSGFAAE
jgi:pilus assembly protein Flp/PilA